MNTIAQHWEKIYQEMGVKNYVMPEFGAFA
jgi:hypothetical protein